MSPKNTILLFLALIILGGYVYFVEIKKHKADEEKEEQSKQIFVVEKDSINYLKIKNADGEFVLNKSQNEWRLTAPLNTGTDESTINSMLDNLNSAKKDYEFATNPMEFGSFGLNNNSIVVQFRTTSGSSDSLRFGDKTPVGSFVFCNTNDSLVFTTNEYIKNSYDKKLYDIRDKKLLHFNRENVRGIVLKNSFGNYEFEKNVASTWDLKTIQRPADDSKLSSILNKLNNNNAKEFVDEEGFALNKYGLQKTKYEIELQLSTEEGKRILSIGSKINGKYYAKDADRSPIFEIDSSLVSDIDKGISEFRDTDFIDFERNEINKFKIEYSDTTVTAMKDTSDNWVIEGFESRVVKSGEINSFFSDLSYSKINKFVKDGKYNPASYGLNNPSLKIYLYKENELFVEATFGEKKEDKVYATTNLYDSVYLLNASKMNDLKVNLDNIFEPEPDEQEVNSDSLSQ